MFFFRGQLSSHRANVTLNNGAKEIVAHINGVEIFYFFVGRSEVSPEHVAYVADKIAEHYGIQIDDTNTLAVLVKQHIADLSVVMRDTKFHVAIFLDLLKFSYNLILFFNRVDKRF